MKINTQFYISLLIVLSIAGCNITKQSTEVVQIETPVQLENKISISDSKKELHVPKNYTVHCNPFAEYQFVKPYSKPYSWENYRREILNSQGYQTYLTPANNDKIKQPAISIFFTTDDSFFDQIDLKADNVSNTKIANTNAYTIQFPDLERIIVVNSKGTYQIDLVNFTDSEQDVKSNFLESFTLDINHELCITMFKDAIL